MELSPQQVALRDTTDRFLRDRIVPDIARAEREKQFDWGLMKELAQFGLLGATVAEDDGGLALGYCDFSVLMETVGYHWLSLRALLNVSNMVSQLLSAHGSEWQKQAYLRPLLKGEKRAFIAITEPDHGSDVSGIAARAVEHSDWFELHGRKQWITNGFGDFGIVLCKLAGERDAEPRFVTLIVDREEMTYDVRRLHTMILRATETTELAFDGTRVPRRNLLGTVGGGLRNILSTLSHGRVSVASGAVGAASAALDLSIEYVKSRRQFGRPIGAQQLVQEMIAEMAALTSASRLLCRDAASRLDNGETARVETSIAKRQSTEWAHRVATLALQAHGGIGYSDELPIERIFRDTRGGTIPEGTTQIQSLIIGRELIGLDAFNPARGQN